MSSDGFVKVFDLLESGFKSWTFPAFGLVFVALGIAMYLKHRRDLSPFLNQGLKPFSKKKQYFPALFLIFSVAWTILTYLGVYLPHRRHYKMMLENACTVVEGPVENFIPMPYSGHRLESFFVSGVRFSYSDYLVNDGFNQTASHGGPISKDSYVRICYDPKGNHILRLEIRDARTLLGR